MINDEIILGNGEDFCRREIIMKIQQKEVESNKRIIKKLTIFKSNNNNKKPQIITSFFSNTLVFSVYESLTPLQILTHLLNLRVTSEWISILRFQVFIGLFLPFSSHGVWFWTS